MTQILKLIERETEVVKKNYADYEEILNQLNKIFLMFWKMCFILPNDRQYQYFGHFFIDTRNQLMLSLLNLLREHFILSQLSLRRSLESMVNSIYFMNIENYSILKTKKINDINLNQKDLKKIYAYIDENFKEFSKQVKIFKKNLSNFFIHSNELNVEYSILLNKNGEIRYDFFDTISEKTFIIAIGWIGSLIVKYVEVIYLSDKKIKELKKDRIVIFDEKKANNLSLYEYKNEMLKMEKELSSLQTKYDN